ncbi:glycoside hydrolase family 79 [Moniliophthora roreri MCA 2997]|uniref:Glycoside hydrolase family 79 n=1 Tax=Moniliophthora roreri (strain MCA 2997) TaxID=1381753 RepID=V2WT66_MONRO|nr:glycoside hydrolase family 79 [Moniliophthora roreri MCA 2997]
MWFSPVLFSILAPYVTHAVDTPTTILLASPRLPQGASKPIVNNFVSLSIAIHWFQDYTRQGSNASQPNTFTRNLLNSLTESTSVAPQIRIGGTSADRTTYVPDQEETIKTVTGDNGIPLNVTLNERWFRQCFEDTSFPPGTKFIFDLPLMRNDSGAIDNTVRGAQWALGAIREERFMAFEIGNEEDLYPGQGVTPRSWTIIGYVERWRRFAGAILERVVKPSKLDSTKKWFQGLVFAGLGYNPDWTTQTAFAAGINEDGLLKSVSLHNYPAGSAPWVTLGRTFMNHGAIVANISQVNDDLEFLQSSPETWDLDFVLGETNIDFVNLKMEQFEGVLGSALWTIDYILYAAFSNVARVYLHQGTTFGYAAWQPVPVNDIQPKVRPPWYGLKFAAEAIGFHHGPIQIATIAPTTNESTDQLSVYAIYESFALARIAIINFNEWNATTPYTRPTINFRIALGIRGTKATGRRLTAPEGASADTGLSFGGVVWNYSTNGIPENVDDVHGNIALEADSEGVLEVGVKSSEAMLVQLHR